MKDSQSEARRLLPGNLGLQGQPQDPPNHPRVKLFAHVLGIPQQMAAAY